jgi:hypothetical protein
VWRKCREVIYSKLLLTGTILAFSEIFLGEGKKKTKKLFLWTLSGNILRSWTKSNHTSCAIMLNRVFCVITPTCYFGKHFLREMFQYVLCWCHFLLWKVLSFHELQLNRPSMIVYSSERPCTKGFHPRWMGVASLCRWRSRESGHDPGHWMSLLHIHNWSQELLERQL